MKITAASGALTIDDADDKASVHVTAGPYMIRRCETQEYVEVSGAFGSVKIHTATVTDLGGSTFSGNTQDIVDALVTGLAPV